MNKPNFGTVSLYNEIEKKPQKLFPFVKMEEQNDVIPLNAAALADGH